MRNQQRLFLPTAAVVVLALAFATTAFPTAAVAGRASPTMLEFTGGPHEVGTLWGKTNAASIRSDFQEYFIKPARAQHITDATLVERSAAFVRICNEIAPHWLKEAEAIADAAGIDRPLYIAFIAGVYRSLFLHDECTSYAVSAQFAERHLVLFHKNRDNAPKAQSAAIIASNVQGINKFITITDASVLACMMMVNDKGLAGSADTGGTLEVDRPAYRGMMNTFILRHIAETASSCQDALRIIQSFVKKGWYAGGAGTGTHWLFVDRTGAILEVSNNSDAVACRYHSGEKTYFSVREDTKAARSLANSELPITFQLFHGISRDRSICFDTSIAGLTAVIDARRPDFLTSAWISLPARGLSFVLLMGGAKTPLPLVDGAAYKLMDSIAPEPALFEETDASAYSAEQRLEKRVESFLARGQDNRASGAIDAWVHRSAAATMATMEKIRISAAAGYHELQTTPRKPYYAAARKQAGFDRWVSVTSAPGASW
jgi:hypothetical protein